MPSPEARLLLLTAGGREADAQIRALLPRVTRWERLIEYAMREGAQPVFTRRLQEVAADTVPPDHARTLRRLADTMEVRLRYLERRLCDALGVLSRAGLPVMLLKGAAMAHTTYGAFRERPMSDLDLLVRPEHAPAAQALLREAGWTPRFPEESDWLYRGMHHLPPLTDTRVPAMKVHLELHTDLFPPRGNPFALGAADLWGAALPAAGLPVGTLVPGALHRLLHACLHFGWSHMLERAAWRTFRDVAAMVREGSVDWGAFVRAAGEVRGASCAYWTLRLALEHSVAPVPEAVLERLRPGGSSRRTERIARHLAHEVTGNDRACPSVWLRRRFWEAAIRPESSGHGPARPWDVCDRPWRLRGEAPAADGETASPRAALSPLAWARYIHVLLLA